MEENSENKNSTRKNSLTKNTNSNLSNFHFTKLVELILTISAQCDRREFYLDIMQQMDDFYSTEIYNILTEMITNNLENLEKNKKFENSNEESEESDLEEFNEKIKLKGLVKELENDKRNLNQKNERLIELNKNLEIEGNFKEKNLKEIEEKYILLVDSMNYEKNKVNNSSIDINNTDSVGMSIQISELKGILEGKEKSYKKFKEEKEANITQLKYSNGLLIKEIDELKDFRNRYEKLESEYSHSKDKVNTLEKKLISLKEENDLIRKRYDISNNNVIIDISNKENKANSQKLELLNTQVSNLNYKLDTLEKENKKYLDLLGDENRNKNKENVINNANDNNNIQFNVKLEILQNDNISLKKEKIEIREMLEKLNEELNQCNKKLEKFKKKEEKYKSAKEYKRDLITKNSELMEENLILKEKNQKIFSEENEKFKEKEKLMNVKN